MPLREAAAVLGISKDAVRQRIRRGTLRSDKGEDGRVYVYLDASTDDVHDEPRQREDTNQPLVDELHDRIHYLERQVEEEREARRRADTLLARLMDRMPELEGPAESPPEPPGAPETGAEGEGRGRQGQEPTEAAEGGVRRPWWRRVFRS